MGIPKFRGCVFSVQLFGAPVRCLLSGYPYDVDALLTALGHGKIYGTVTEVG